MMMWKRRASARGLALFIFIRVDGWYPVEIPADQLQANIDLNPGTLRVEDAQGKVLWRAPDTDTAEPPHAE